MKRSLACLVAGFFLVPAWLWAAPVQWSENGHYYDILFLKPGERTWTDAREAALNWSYNGLRFDLATLTSQAENDWLYTTLIKPLGILGNAWLGGYQDGSASKRDEGWQWVTGETWNYANWGRFLGLQEPNDGWPPEDHQQDYLGFFNLLYGNGWADLRQNQGGMLFAVLESVPIPGAGWLLGCGIVGLALLKRKMAM